MPSRLNSNSTSGQRGLSAGGAGEAGSVASIATVGGTGSAATVGEGQAVPSSVQVVQVREKSERSQNWEREGSGETVVRGKIAKRGSTGRIPAGRSPETGKERARARG